MRRTGTWVLVLISVLVFAGVAYAGNGNGNGNGNEGGSPGNSADAPGQVKKDTPPPAGETTTVATAPTTTAAGAPSAPDNSSGVKPSNETAHDTHAEAQSDTTKQYGNGQTAGQIAEKNGAAGNAVLHGPGNSQPHKLAPCSGGHEVDVHALKSHRGVSCGGPTPHPVSDPVPTPNPGPPVVITTTQTSTTEQKPSKSDPGSTPVQGGSSSGVATSAEEGGDTPGVLPATKRIGHAATLPFTGQRLWLVALLGVILIATGLALREIRTGEAPVECGHDHADRSRHAARSTGGSVGGRPGR